LIAQKVENEKVIGGEKQVPKSMEKRAGSGLFKAKLPPILHFQTIEELLL
jgi:hypothetical protein